MKTIDELTIGEVKELSKMFGGITQSGEHPYEIGKNYFIRTVTMSHTGKLVAVTQQELVLEDAAWIADTGRFADAVSGKVPFSEIEPVPNGRLIVGRASVIDAFQITFTLPRAQK